MIGLHSAQITLDNIQVTLIQVTPVPVTPVLALTLIQVTLKVKPQQLFDTGAEQHRVLCGCPEGELSCCSIRTNIQTQ